MKVGRKKDKRREEAAADPTDGFQSDAELTGKAQELCGSLTAIVADLLTRGCYVNVHTVNPRSRIVQTLSVTEDERVCIMVDKFLAKLPDPLDTEDLELDDAADDDDDDA